MPGVVSPGIFFPTLNKSSAPQLSKEAMQSTTDN
jgi:hypothetical protein